MGTDHTQQQSSEEQRQAKALSLQKARPPADIPGYTMKRLLGCGAFGEVWIGVDRNTGRQVAIKFYTHRSGGDWPLLWREVEKLVYLSADRYVVQLLDVGWDADPPYYVMDYIENGSLEDLLRQQGALPVSQATELFWEMATGLLHAHGKGVLHCDLKPANVLLDQDHKPRLADFGQSRLSTEQSPALGTLFYMAPEQADLKSLPDARWDVYALGAIFYCMITGEPPFRTAESVRRIEEAENLAERLARYRSVIRSAPCPTQHRRVPGVDRALAEIIDRCLAVDPQRRYPNVQAVLDAMQARQQARMRRPLMLLGFVGPVLLLFIMGFFGLRGYDHAVRDSQAAISRRARETNEFAAKFAARSIEAEIERYFRLIRKEAESRELYQLFSAVAGLDIVTQMNDPRKSGREIAALRPEFLKHPARSQLNDYLRQRLAYYLERVARDPSEAKFSSILLLDTRGRMLAAAYDDLSIDFSVGWNYAYRTYFHGGPADLPNLTKEDNPQNVPVLSDTHLSAAFRSTATGTWKVAISTPIFDASEPEDLPVGVLAVTLNLGDFAFFRSNYRADQFAVLIDGREGPSKGLVLQHPLFDRLRQAGSDALDELVSAEYRVTDQQLQRIRSDKTWYPYQDPMQHAEGGEEYVGDWVAAIAGVSLPDSRGAHSDMIVLVQERYLAATAPVQKLGNRLKRDALWALTGMLGVFLVLWCVVLRMLEEPPPYVRQPVEGSPMTLHSTTTLVSPSSSQGAQQEGRGSV
mgnify:CR=1 FL=1